MPAILRSILAIVAGFVVTVSLSLGADAALCAAFPHSFDSAGISRQPGRLAIPLVYTAVSAALGSYVAALLAGRRPLLHAMILGGLGFALAIPTAVLYWHAQPAWYHVCALAFVLPAAWLGGRLRAGPVRARTSLPG